MNETNNVIARFTYGNSTKTKGIFQWDHGMILKFEGIELPTTYTVHFANQLMSGNAKTQVGNADGVEIYDEYLTTGLPVYAWVYLHTGESDGETVYSVMIPVTARPRPVEDAPTPVQQGAIDTAIAALNAGVATVEGIAEAIPQTVDTALQAAKDSGEFDGPPGRDGTDGLDGRDGTNGVDGYSPTATVTQTSGGATISITDKSGTTTASISNGTNGQNGSNGQDGDDGYSPTVAVTDITGGHRVVITDVAGAHTFDVLDGAPGSGATIHICSSSEYDSITRVPTVQNPDENTFYLVPASDGASPDMFVEWIYTNNAWEMFGSASVDLSGYQTKITASGVLKGNGSGGVSAATAGTDYGTYSKPSGGIPSTDMTEAVQTSLGKADTALQSAPVADVQVNGTSIVNNNVANVPLAGTTDAGVVKVASGNGIKMTDGALQIDTPNITQIKSATNYYLPITPAYQHAATFYGLAAASGDSTQRASENVVGEYTDSAKSSIQSMLDATSQAAIASKETATATAAHAIGDLFLMGGKLYKATAAIAIGDAIVTSGAGANAEQTSVAEEIPTVPVTDVQVNGTSILSSGVANVPVMDSSTFGVAKQGSGITIVDGVIKTNNASDSAIKTGTNTNSLLTPGRQHASVFYGLAKAAGDSTQSSSSNAVGTYTEDAKSAISTMLNGAVSISGSTPSIATKAGIRYICGEVSTLDITTPASGIIDVVFESGSTPTVLTVTPPTGMTMKWANGFDPSSLEANTTYEINVCDGLGVAASWT